MSLRHSSPPVGAGSLYICTFDRIGKDDGVGSHEFWADDLQCLIERVADFALGRLRRFREIEVELDPRRMHGWITVGGHRPAGEFVVTEGP